MSVAECIAGRCRNSFQPVSDLQNSDGFSTVSVAAENVVGEGVARNCTAQNISELHTMIAETMYIFMHGSNCSYICHSS